VKDEVQQTRLVYRRSCTDVLVLCVYIAFWGIALWNVFDCKKQGGDPNKIFRGIDLNGKICGVDPEVLDKKYAAWPRPTVADYQAKICVASCSETNDPKSTQMSMLYNSKPIDMPFYHCVPFFSNDTSVSINITLTGDFKKAVDGVKNIAVRSIGDVMSAYELIFLSCAAAVVVSYGFVFMLRYVAGALVILCLCLLIGGGTAFGFFSLNYSKGVDTTAFLGEEKKALFEYSAYVVWVATGIFLLVSFFLREQLKIAIEVVKEGARAVGDMKTIIFFPILPLLMAVAYLAAWVVGLTYCLSISEFKREPTPVEVLMYDNPAFGPNNRFPNANPGTMLDLKFDENKLLRPVAIHLFHGFWTVQFFIYFGFTAMAGAIASWYFAERDEGGQKIRGSAEDELPEWPIWHSMGRVWRNHLGTVATASLIIAVIQFMRACVKYVELKIKGSGVKISALQKVLLCMIGCCLKCVECCMDKVNKNALIWCSIYGDGFCTSTCSSFALLWRNLARVAAVNTVSTLLLHIGKFTVALTIGAIAWATILVVPRYKENGDSPITSPVSPCIVIFLCSYLVAKIFMMIFETVVDTVFLCFLVDCENNGPGMMLASKGLQMLVGKYEGQSKDLARIEKLQVDLPLLGGDSEDSEGVKMDNMATRKSNASVEG